MTAVLIGACPATVLLADELDYGLERHRLARIDLTGNETFTDDQLKAVLRIEEPDWKRPLAIPKYEPYLIDTQLRLIESYYQRRGFQQVAVALDSIAVVADKGDVIYISVVEGRRTWIEKVEFIGRGTLTESELREQVRLIEGEPAPMDLNDLGADIYAMRSLYWDRAFLDVHIASAMTVTSDAAADRLAVTIVYTIEPGPAYTIGAIDIFGNDQTRLDLITRELQVREGGLFAWGDVENSRRRLLETSLFRDVVMVPTDRDSTRGTAGLRVLVIERKPAFYEVGLGIGSRERIRLSAAWGHNNLWGTGRRLYLRGKLFWNVEPILGRRRSFSEGEINYRVEALYVNPHLRGSDFRLDLSSFIKRQTRGESALILNTYAVAIGTGRRYGLRWDHRIGIQFKENQPERHPLAPPDLRERYEQADITDTRTNSLIYSVLHDRRDDPFQPQGGSMASTEFQLAADVLGGDNSFFKWWGAWHKYAQVPLGGVLAYRVRLGVAVPYGSSAAKGPDGVPYDDRFFAGGASSVRGYRENILGPQIQDQKELDELEFGSGVPLADNPARGGNWQLIANVEWRFPLPLLSRWNLAGVLFFDSGNVWAEAKDIQLKAFRLRSYPGPPGDPNSTKLWDYRYSVGPGVRLDTPFGPFRLDVGFPLKRAAYFSLDVRIEDPKVVYHFSLGYPF